MAGKQPISTAPKDGSKVTVFWTDEDGQENESIGQYRSLERLKATGGQWDETDAGWWIFTDSNTQKKVSPQSWQPAGKSRDDEDQSEAE
ncbi:hypothetical protein GF108_13520 [Phyllobacterium sp. SYP-B3895]|jgi:hypothetical protein|uniref:Uncharacterized protein n=1 Tax=Phyllobacterium pellucidum TaxID=2740464 RepID=A0A849VW20_9HYPH|nr:MULTISPECIES: hypothetical protein [Phyllobacterium]MRG56596.1 hypothetical protein [Phyllobacterium sp. SYP-B3895]NTS32043.1 hypothetical protein [Phyllobacterium pellucidum]UGY09473.1 hypothetical protein LLE51_015900 [Phyllobacterium sp. T1018]SFJ36168.1 hypothetical protein SAMN04515648_3709 [Phyllobacterium sp. CL33Tsu]